MAFNRRTIAAGAFGKIYKEKYGDTWAAIKRVPQHLISKKDLERECQVYNKATHPNIVKLLGDITFKDSKWVLPLEFIFGEDLETTIFKASRSKIQLTPSNRGTIILGMCEGLLHLHLKDIVHQDLKPENIMVEHGTNRAVIIDLGLAKFFRNGLSSAIDMGNEAYSAPEVLRRGSQRDQRSDVWAMGKIIAELCARIRLHTPSVCPAKIKETLRDQPHCPAVCRMVESDPTLRASMAGVINDIRRAGGGGITGGPPPRGHLLVPETRNRSPSPIGRTPSPRGRAPSPVITLPVNRAPPPVSRWERAASPKRENAGLHPQAVTHRSPSPIGRTPSPIGRAPSPVITLPVNRAPPPVSRWERAASPKPGNAGLHPQAVTHRSPSPRPTDKSKIQALVPAEATGLSQDMMKMMLYKEATKDLPCGLPTTGVVTVRRFEEKDGEIETWGQTEVVTRGGRIVKYDDVRFNNREGHKT